MANKKYKVVICTPAGRSKYLRILAAHIGNAQKNGVVDRWDLWLNTQDDADIAFIEEMARTYPWINIVRINDANFTGRETDLQWNLYKFHCLCDDPEALYIRIDDDVVWMASDAIQNLVNARLRHEYPVIIYGNVLNSTLNSYIQQRLGNIHTNTGVCKYETFDRTSLFLPSFAKQLHEDIVRDIHNRSTGKYLFGEWRLFDFEHHSIMVSAFFGKRIAELKHLIVSDDEKSFSDILPKAAGAYNIVDGQSLFVHHTYYYQRRELCTDEEGIDIIYRLDDYQTFAERLI